MAKTSKKSTKVAETVAEEYDTFIGQRNSEEAPGSLSEMFGLEDVPSDEKTAWKEMWKGMPSYTAKEKAAKSLTINFTTEEDFDNFIKLVGFKTINNKSKSTWYPEIPPIDRMALRFIDEE